MELTKQIGVLRNRKTLDGRKADRTKVNLEYWNFSENLGDLRHSGIAVLLSLQGGG